MKLRAPAGGFTACIFACLTTSVSASAQQPCLCPEDPCGIDALLHPKPQVHEQSQVFLNVRYIGGGATNSDPDNYAKNWLHFLFVGLGASLDLLSTPTRVR